MPRLPRVTARETERAIMRDGWYHVGGSGSHRQYCHPTKSGRVTIATHARTVLKPSTLRTIITQAGLTVEQFSALLQEAVVARYTVLLYPEEEGGYSVLVPVLGVATQGETVEEGLAMAQDLIQVATRGLIEDGEP